MEEEEKRQKQKQKRLKPNMIWADTTVPKEDVKERGERMRRRKANKKNAKTNFSLD